MSSANSEDIICMKCNVELVEAKVNFSYLKHNFDTTLLRCPVCGQVYIPETLVKGKMNEVEKALEEK